MVKRYDFISRNDEFQMEHEGDPRESETGKYVLYSDYAAHIWMADHGQKLRNAIADCIPLGEPCGDQALIDYPAKMKSQLAQLREEPVHLGCFYNDEEGITTIYVLDKDGNETDREVKAECLLKRISKYFKKAKELEAENAKLQDSILQFMDGETEIQKENEGLKKRLNEAREIFHHINLQFPLEDYGLSVLKDVREFLAVQPEKKD